MLDLRLVPFTVLLLYSAGIVAVATASGMSFTLLLVLLLLLPLIILLNREQVALAPLSMMVLLGATLLLILEAFARITGSWYSVSPSVWPGWSGITIDAALFSILHTLYIVVLYEYFFDDRAVTGVRYVHRFGRSAVVFLLLLGCSYAVLFLFLEVAFAFTWLLATLLFTTGGVMLLSSPKTPGALFAKIRRFTILMAPISLLLEIVATVYGVRIYAFESDYLATFTWFGAAIPLEEILLVILLPGILAWCYELFIDDAR